MEKLSADALRLALVTASMEYYKKYVEGNQDFDNSEQIKEELVQTGSKLQAVKHVKESAKCGLKEAKDFVDTYCDYVL